MQLYEYAIYYAPEDDEGHVLKSECKIIAQPQTMLASDEKAVTLKAAKSVPDDEGLDLEFVRIVVRPF